MNKITERLIEKEKTLKKRKEKILENEEYINWLEEYTESKDIFTNDEARDENVESLEALYLIIEKYAEDNYIFPSKNTFGYYYTVKYNNMNYNIGYIAGQEVYFYCERTNEEATINFKDILEGKKQLSTELIKLKLNKLNLLINELSLTLPEEYLKREVSKVYKHKKRGVNND